MPHSRGVLVCFALLLLAGTLGAHRADRVTITGIVSDPTGNSIPNAAVRIRNENTGVETTLTTNEVGLYTSPLMVLGSYTVTAEHAGFKASVQSNLQVVGGETYRIDLRLELGTVTE